MADAFQNVLNNPSERAADYAVQMRANELFNAGQAVTRVEALKKARAELATRQSVRGSVNSAPATVDRMKVRSDPLSVPTLKLENPDMLNAMARMRGTVEDAEGTVGRMQDRTSTYYAGQQAMLDGLPRRAPGASPFEVIVPPKEFGPRTPSFPGMPSLSDLPFTIDPRWGDFKNDAAWVLGKGQEASAAAGQDVRAVEDGMRSGAGAVDGWLDATPAGRDYKAMWGQVYPYTPWGIVDNAITALTPDRPTGPGESEGDVASIGGGSPFGTYQGPAAVAGGAPASSGTVIPGSFYDYTQGLPFMGSMPRPTELKANFVGMPSAPTFSLPERELPDTPDLTAAREAMKAARPLDIDKDPSATKREDSLMAMLPLVLQGLGSYNETEGWGMALLRAAAGGAMGVAGNQREMKAETRERQKELEAYQRWMTVNETNLSQGEFQNKMALAGMQGQQDLAQIDVSDRNWQNRREAVQDQNSIAAQQFEIDARNEEMLRSWLRDENAAQQNNAALKYDADMRNAKDRQPTISGDNLITRDEKGNWLIDSTDPRQKMFKSLVAQGGMPPSANSMKLPMVLSAIPEGYRGVVGDALSETTQDANFMAATAMSDAGAAGIEAMQIDHTIRRLEQTVAAGGEQAGPAAMALSALQYARAQNSAWDLYKMMDK